MNVLVVDDQPIYRKGIVKILGGLEFVENCHEAENYKMALEKFKKHIYNIVFLNIMMPVMDGYTAAQIIKYLYPAANIIILTTLDSKRQIIELIEIGISGYLLKRTDEEELVKALKLIYEGHKYFTPEIYRIWADYKTKNPSLPTVKTRAKLTSRELEIIKLLCDQYTARAIANILNISEATINNHRSHIMQKIGVDNIVGLVIYAIERGIYSV